MKIQIKPALRYLHFVEIGGVNVSLDNSALINGFITGENGLRESFSLYMNPETYAQWGEDDAFAVDWTLQELGLERP